MLAKLLAWVRLIISARTAEAQYSSGGDRQGDAHDYLRSVEIVGELRRAVALAGRRPIHPDPEGRQPPCNRALEDLLASARAEEERHGMLVGMLVLSAETLAREAGRGAAIHAVGLASDLVRHAEPSRPWPP